MSLDEDSVSNDGLGPTPGAFPIGVPTIAAPAVKHARRPVQSTTIHAFPTRLGSVIDGI